MAKNRFSKIKGTKDFLVATVVCTFFFLWFLRDGWFPPKRVLKDHPLQMEISVKVPGVVKALPSKPGQEVRGEMVLVELYSGAYQEAVDQAAAAFETAKEEKAADVQDKLDALLAARADLKACVLKCADLTQNTSHGEDKLQGVVLEHLVQVSAQVDAGQTVLLVRPKDGYYLFNKASCILSFIGAIVALFFHRIASR